MPLSPLGRGKAGGKKAGGSKHPNRATHYPLYTSLCTGELNAIRKHKCFLCSPFYVKGVLLGHVGRNQNLTDIKPVANKPVGARPASRADWSDLVGTGNRRYWSRWT